MKIFDWIRGYFEKFRSRFRKKKPEQILRDRIKNIKGKSQDAIRTEIKERVQQKESISAEEISELAGSQTVGFPPGATNKK
jgi:hypothetical protein